MVAIASESRPAQVSCEDVGERFLEMLPLIEKLARRACRGKKEDAQDEFVAEVVANAYSAFVQLPKRGRLEIAYPTPLATFAIRQVRCGRRVGGRLNSADISSEYCQAVKRIKVESLVERDEATGQWREMLVEDKRSTPADVVAVRIDLSIGCVRLVANSGGSLPRWRVDAKIAFVVAAEKQNPCFLDDFCVYGCSIGRCITVHKSAVAGVKDTTHLHSLSLGPLLPPVA